MDTEYDYVQHQLQIWRSNFLGPRATDLQLELQPSVESTPGPSHQHGEIPFTSMTRGNNWSRSPDFDDIRDGIGRFLCTIRVRSVLIYNRCVIPLMSILNSIVIRGGTFLEVDINQTAISLKSFRGFFNTPLSIDYKDKYIGIDCLELLHKRRGWNDALLNFMLSEYHGVTLLGIVTDLRPIDPRLVETADKLFFINKDGRKFQLVEVGKFQMGKLCNNIFP